MRPGGGDGRDRPRDVAVDGETLSGPLTVAESQTAADPSGRPPFAVRTKTQAGTTRPLPWLVARPKRSAASAQLTTFHHALT